MNKTDSDFVFKVSDVLVDIQPSIFEKRQISAWQITDMDDFQIGSAVDVEAEFQKIDQGLIFGKFKIHLILLGKCFRCVEPVKKEIDFNTEASFTVYDNVDDAEFKISKYGNIDIQPLLEQEIITHLPQNFLCKSDCKGLCPVCGVNINKKKCQCKVKSD